METLGIGMTLEELALAKELQNTAEKCRDLIADVQTDQGRGLEQVIVSAEAYLELVKMAERLATGWSKALGDVGTARHWHEISKLPKRPGRKRKPTTLAGLYKLLTGSSPKKKGRPVEINMEGKQRLIEIIEFEKETLALAKGVPFDKIKDRAAIDSLEKRRAPTANSYARAARVTSVAKLLSRCRTETGQPTRPKKSNKSR